MDKYAVRHWLEFGDPESFRHSKVLACDASMERVSFARGVQTSGGAPGELLPVAGAVVDGQGHWWAWRAEVMPRHAGRATAWAECWTLLRTLQLCRPGATVLADHMGAIGLAQGELTGARKRYGVRPHRIEAIFGPLPAVHRASTTVRHYNGEMLFHRADEMSRVVREGGPTARIVARCEQIAAVIV